MFQVSINLINLFATNSVEYIVISIITRGHSHDLMNDRGFDRVRGQLLISLYCELRRYSISK